MPRWPASGVAGVVPMAGAIVVNVEDVMVEVVAAAVVVGFAFSWLSVAGSSPPWFFRAAVEASLTNRRKYTLLPDCCR